MPSQDIVDVLEPDGVLGCKDAEQARDFLTNKAAAAPIFTPPAQSSTTPNVDQAATFVRPAFVPIGELISSYPQMRQPVVNGLLRRGETMNIIAPSKGRKTYLVSDLALAIATGRKWLDTFDTLQGDVLILDNELHRETTAHRLPQIAQARGIHIDDYGKRIMVDNLRGRLLTILDLPMYFSTVAPRRFIAVILDSLYRFWPPKASENDNAAIAGFYNIIDSVADRLECCFIVVHHTSKGNQAAKSTVDVGAGAGAIARAVDAHLILLPHETDCRKAPAMVLDAAGRSFPPIEPLAIRFDFPVWRAASDLDATALKPDRPRRNKPAKEDGREPIEPKPIVDATQEFTAKYITKDPQTRATIIDAAIMGGLTENRAKKMLAAAEGRKIAFRWTAGPRKPELFATLAQPALDLAEGKK